MVILTTLAHKLNDAGRLNIHDEESFADTLNALLVHSMGELAQHRQTLASLHLDVENRLIRAVRKDELTHTVENCSNPTFSWERAHIIQQQFTQRVSRRAREMSAILAIPEEEAMQWSRDVADSFAVALHSFNKKGAGTTVPVRELETLIYKCSDEVLSTAKESLVNRRPINVDDFAYDIEQQITAQIYRQFSRRLVPLERRITYDNKSGGKGLS